VILSVWFRIRVGLSATAHSATDCSTTNNVSARGEIFGCDYSRTPS
jgi:hypothetical protein